MATPVFCCGLECGIATNTTNTHIRDAGSTAVSISTTTVRSGLRALRCNTSASDARVVVAWSAANELRHVGRVYIRFATLPDADTILIWTINTSVPVGPVIFFKQSDSKIYAAVAGAGAATLGATGVSVTTGVWYLIDFNLLISLAGNETADGRVNGTALGQASAAATASGTGELCFGVIGDQPDRTITADVFFDDIIISATSGDYPFGHGYVLSYIPNADGSHNVAGANDFERTLTGTDITNATTTAYQLVDDRPMESAAGDFINGIAPPNSTDYVEIAYEDSVENVAPRSVEAIVGYHDAGGAGTNNFSVTLRESGGGTTADIMAAATRNVGSTMSWGRAHFATVPGTSDAWTLTKFNALRSRFLVSDASPDPYIDGLMLEAEYPGIVTVTAALKKLTAALNAEQSASGFQVEMDPVLKKTTASLNAEQRYTVEIDSVLAKVTASLIAYLRPEAEIDATIKKLAASLNAEQRQLVEIDSTLAKVTASLNVEQRQLVTIDSDIVKVAANINVAETPDFTINSTIAKVQANINVSQQLALHIISTLAKVTSSLNVIMVPDFVIVSTLRKLAASINVSQRQELNIDSDLVKVQAALNVSHRQELTIVSSLAHVMANINASSIDARIVSVLKAVTASLNAEHRQELHITSTLAKVSSNINLSLIDARIASTLRSLSASLNAEQRQFITIQSTLAHVTAAINAVMQPEFSIASTLTHVRAALFAEQQGFSPELTINSTLRKLSASLSASQRYELSIASVLQKVMASLNASQIDQLHIASTLRAVAANLNLQQQYLLSIDSDLRKVMAAFNMSQQQELHIDADLAKVVASLQSSTFNALHIDSDLEPLAASLSLEAQQMYQMVIITTLARLLFSGQLVVPVPVAPGEEIPSPWSLWQPFPLPAPSGFIAPLDTLPTPSGFVKPAPPVLTPSDFIEEDDNTLWGIESRSPDP